MGMLDDRIAVITGAGNGLGLEYARLFAKEGAKLVVNDLGVTPTGTGEDASVAQRLVGEIGDLGGEAVANTDDVRLFDTGRRLVDLAVETFGDLHVVVNSAGVLRPGPLPDMDEEDWDTVVDISLKGAFNTTRWAAAYWRDQTALGKDVKASVIHNCSPLGAPADLTRNNASQRSDEISSALGDAPDDHITLGLNHWAAKGAAAEFTLHCAVELAAFGVRSNTVIPSGWSRLSSLFPFLADIEIPDEVFHPYQSANNAPLVAWLAMKDCPANGAVLGIHGGTVQIWNPWEPGATLDKDGRWSLSELVAQMPRLLSQARTTSS